MLKSPLCVMRTLVLHCIVNFCKFRDEPVVSENLGMFLGSRVWWKGHEGGLCGVCVLCAKLGCVAYKLGSMGVIRGTMSADLVQDWLGSWDIVWDGLGEPPGMKARVEWTKSKLGLRGIGFYWLGNLFVLLGFKVG